MSSTYEGRPCIDHLQEVDDIWKLEWNQQSMFCLLEITVDERCKDKGHIQGNEASTGNQEPLINANPRRVADTQKDWMIILLGIFRK